MKVKKKRAKKVWRIFRFAQRFELPDDTRFCRRSPLIYVRDFVGSGLDDESINYKRQIIACKASPNRHKLLAVFFDMREIAANYSRCFRGYILDERFEPANVNKIAGWVGLNISETYKILKELEQIGLIEKVSLPEFDPSINEPPGESNKAKKDKGRSRRRTKEHKGKKRKPRAISGAHGKSRAPLNKKKTESGNGNSKGKSSGKPDKGKKKKTATTPTTTPDPINPKGTDAGVGRKAFRPRNLPRGSVNYKQTVKLGSVLRKLYDPEAEQFAQEVYDAIGTHYAKDSREGRSELACWKAAWAEAQMAGVNPAYLTELWDKIISEAMKLKLKRRRTSVRFRRSPEAVLRWLFDRILASIERRAEKESREAMRAIGSG